ncbi:TTLL5 family protein [Megaselia abdita]
MYEKPLENSWITSGHLGSKDAVLVFRTSILNSRNSELEESMKCDNGSSSSNSLNIMTSSCGYDVIEAKVLTSLPKSNINLSNSNINKTLKSPKKRLHESLSSSDNSIYSDGCDDHIEMDGDISKSMSNDNVSIEEENEADVNEDKDNDHDQIDLFPDISELPASKLKITYKFHNSETKLLKRIFSQHGLKEVEGEQNFSILWTGVHMKPDILRNLTPYQRVNHFPRSYELTRKDRLYKNIEKMQHLRGFKHFDIVPQSFVLPLEYRDLVSAHNKYRGPWIVKPNASSRGRGIYIVTSPEHIPTDEQVLVSKYIGNPLCIDGHKCDIRVYVLVTSFNPLIIYLYEEGLVRLATVKYDKNVENLWNPCMHLCNYSINKYHSDYIKSIDAGDEDVGHKWTLSALLRHLKNQKCDTEKLMSNIEDLIIKSMFACAQSINAACRMFVPNGNNCFELYGFDILIDDSLKPWLLEINLSPSMGIDSPLDTKVKASLITDLLTLIGIPAYSPMMRSHYDTKWTRYKNVSYGRRTNSADPLSNSSHGYSKKKQSAKVAPLTAEEQRILKNVNLQNARRGGFVRIFPTDDSMQKYSSFLDPVTGIPISTSPSQSQSFSMIVPINYNLLLSNYLYVKQMKDGYIQDNTFPERMNQYERALETGAPISFGKKKSTPKSQEEGKKLRQQVRKLIEGGSELTQLQSRQAFGLYLESILKRLTQEPKSLHEKLILKFLSGVSGLSGFKAAPLLFKNNPMSFRIISKDRTAMVAKLLGDYLETYNRDTEAFIDTFDNFGMIPISTFNEFLSHAQETDLESILTLHTNFTHSMPFLYNRCGSSVPLTPPIPAGLHGFLKALPTMVAGGRDNSKIDGYYKNTIENKSDVNEGGDETPSNTQPTFNAIGSSKKRTKSIRVPKN